MAPAPARMRTRRRAPQRSIRARRRPLLPAARTRHGRRAAWRARRTLVLRCATAGREQRQRGWTTSDEAPQARQRERTRGVGTRAAGDAAVGITRIQPIRTMGAAASGRRTAAEGVRRRGSARSSRRPRLPHDGHCRTKDTAVRVDTRGVACARLMRHAVLPPWWHLASGIWQLDATSLRMATWDDTLSAHRSSVAW